VLAMAKENSMLPSISLCRTAAASLLFFAACTTPAFSQTLTSLHTFNDTDGCVPFSGLVRGKDGNFYGTTTNGGGGAGDGTAFKITPAGKFTLLHTFVGGNSDGRLPGASVIRDAAGNLYGTTSNGGPSDAGVVWKITPAGKESVVYAFTGLSDGGYLFSDLLRDTKGNLYGTTFGGGDISCTTGLNGCGTVFKIDNTGHESVIHSFEGGNDGQDPYAGLVMDSAGNLYGDTSYQDGQTFIGGGQVFEISPSGNKTVLYAFDLGGPNGDTPDSDLTFAPGEVLYGTTSEGGDLNVCSGSGCGTIFKIDTSGILTTTHTFEGSPSDASIPNGPLARDSAGNLYGASFTGGLNNLGAVYKMDTSGNITLLHSFTGGSDGFSPRGRLYVSSNGTVYGTAWQGANGCGLAFKITP
jgi:uncharacterized repeat protein (TIGR03803 family)